MATRVIRPVAVNKKEEKGTEENVCKDTFLVNEFNDIESNEELAETGREIKEQEETKPQPKVPTKDENIATWGKGFTTAEYEVLNAKLDAFKINYPLRTAMHREALITYLKYAQMRDKAIEEGDGDGAEQWGKLAAKQAQDAKINPNQLSLADLSDGINNFGKVVEFVEKHEDIIPLLPQFVRQPRDEIDYEIWMFVNYCQRVANTPESTYAEIYAFVDEKYKTHKKDYDFLVREENKHYKEPI